MAFFRSFSHTQIFQSVTRLALRHTARNLFGRKPKVNSEHFPQLPITSLQTVAERAGRVSLHDHPTRHNRLRRNPLLDVAIVLQRRAHGEVPGLGEEAQ